MQIPINKEIRHYQEEIFLGLNLRQMICSGAAIAVAVAVYLGLTPLLGHETGISYNVKKVFDVTQTNGRKAPAVSVNRDPKALITTMLDVSPVEVAATDELPYPNMAAFYNNEKQTLYVKRNVGDSVAVAQCVAQELGHAQLSINSESYSRRDMGFQAVCIG